MKKLSLAMMKQLAIRLGYQKTIGQVAGYRIVAYSHVCACVAVVYGHG